MAQGRGSELPGPLQRGESERPTQNLSGDRGLCAPVRRQAEVGEGVGGSQPLPFFCKGTSPKIKITAPLAKKRSSNFPAFIG